MIYQALILFSGKMYYIGPLIMGLSIALLSQFGLLLWEQI